MEKAGILRGISVGFDPDMSAAEPLDKTRPRGGMRFAKSELLEISVVSVQADVGATVIARSFAARADFLRVIEALPPVGRASIAPAAAVLPRRADGRILSPTMHVWTLQQAERERERVRQTTYEERQAEVRRLGKISLH